MKYDDLIALLDSITLELDYDQWKELFNYYDDHKGTGNKFDQGRMRLELIARNTLEKRGIEVER